MVAERSSASRRAWKVFDLGYVGHVSGWPGFYTGVGTHTRPPWLIYLRPLLLSVLTKTSLGVSAHSPLTKRRPYGGEARAFYDDFESESSPDGYMPVVS